MASLPHIQKYIEIYFQAGLAKAGITRNKGMKELRN